MLEKCYYTLCRKDISYVRFILESYDGLLFMRTIDAAGGLIEIGYHPSRQEDALALLQSLEAEIGLRQSPPPDDLKPLT